VSEFVVLAPHDDPGVPPALVEEREPAILAERLLAGDAAPESEEIGARGGRRRNAAQQRVMLVDQRDADQRVLVGIGPLRKETDDERHIARLDLHAVLPGPRGPVGSPEAPST